MNDPVLVIGEALTDVIDRDGESHRHPGGSPMNVAFGLGRLGIPVRFATQLGDDADGRAIRNHLAEAGVEIDASRLGRTSSAIATIAADGAASYDFDIDWSIGTGPVPFGTPLVHIGSIGALRTPGADAVLETVAGRPEGTLLSLDPNIRPAVIGPHDEVVARVERLFALADVMKLSDEDAAWLYPGTALADVLQLALDRGVAVAAVTRGADGCLLASKAGLVELPAAPTTVADTVGAGDSFMSGLIAALLGNHGGTVDGPRLAPSVATADLERWGLFALTCSGITVSRHGALPPTAAEVREALG